jgi:hypothetical protein
MLLSPYQISPLRFTRHRILCISPPHWTALKRVLPYLKCNGIHISTRSPLENHAYSDDNPRNTWNLFNLKIGGIQSRRTKTATRDLVDYFHESQGIGRLTHSDVWPFHLRSMSGWMTSQSNMVIPYLI